MDADLKITENLGRAVKKENTIEKMKLSRKKIYWISQLSGWSSFILINLIVIASFEELPWQRVLVWIFFGGIGIFFTHLLRKILRKNNWLDLPLKKLITRVITASLITGAIIYAFVFAASYFSGTMNQDELTIATPISGAINTSGVIFLWALIYFAVHYFENYKKKEIESLIWEAAVKDYELKTLKSQLNPHFMFNAMNSIRALIEEEPDAAKAALTKLSNILRYSLQMEKMESVPLEDEMETVRNYLDLERIRFEERLKYNLQVDPQSKKIEIPPMMIQTLVENGIKHGVSKRTTGGEIDVKSKLQIENGESKLKVEIENSGHLSVSELKNSQGFGINNTKHRLNLLYGEEAKFSLKNINGDKVLAELEIPIAPSSE
ncbi:MAG: histidine kinase [Ignavibacteria bacterium]|nr:histidine kinase [Ignavibacteria bacterium]MBT8381989.1 histidine kinase [Ignavibacteria bacterium]MBT8390792.1 histidine kinase [Ignavibacteria bacterium]NNL20164.1 histidine kinase [Ignavibacteriaceae bacterium]